MKKSSEKYIESLVESYPQLECCKNDIDKAIEILVQAIKANRKVITCGNGGSAADAMHIVGELMKSFVLKRKLKEWEKEQLMLLGSERSDFLTKNLQGAIPAISLLGETALITAYSNDETAELMFAQQLWGIGNGGDVFLAISTSGNSENILYACDVAKAKGLKIVGLTGNSENKLKSIADVTISAPSHQTYRIQEYHLPIYHAICLAIENEMFGD